jgi:hypothetical protein
VQWRVPLARKVHKQARRYAERGEDIILVGHAQRVEVIVPRGTERLRITPSPLHSDRDIEHPVTSLSSIWSELGLAQAAWRRPAAALIEAGPVARSETSEMAEAASRRSRFLIHGWLSRSEKPLAHSLKVARIDTQQAGRQGSRFATVVPEGEIDHR